MLKLHFCWCSSVFIFLSLLSACIFFLIIKHCSSLGWVCVVCCMDLINHMLCYWDHARLYGDGRCSAVDKLSRWRHFLLGEELKICSRNEPQLASSVCWRRALFHQRGRNLIREREQQRNGGSFSFLYELRPWGVVILAWRSDSLYHQFQMERMCQSNSYLFLLVYVWNVKRKKIKLCLLFHFSVFQHGLDSHCGLA